MNAPRRFDPAGAGLTLLASVLLCGAVGLGVGILVGAAPLLAIAGVFIGFGIGFRLVYTRFKHI